MIESWLPSIIVGIVFIILIFVVVFAITGRHKDFIRKANRITNGMTINEVINILEESPTSRETDGDKKMLIWEKSQWRGMLRGGTLVRSLKVVFQNGKVISVSTKNLDKSPFW